MDIQRVINIIKERENCEYYIAEEMVYDTIDLIKKFPEDAIEILMENLELEPDYLLDLI